MGMNSVLLHTVNKAVGRRKAVRPLPRDAIASKRPSGSTTSRVCGTSPPPKRPIEDVRASSEAPGNTTQHHLEKGTTKRRHIGVGVRSSGVCSSESRVAAPSRDDGQRSKPPYPPCNNIDVLGNRQDEVEAETMHEDVSLAGEEVCVEAAVATDDGQSTEDLIMENEPEAGEEVVEVDLRQVLREQEEVLKRRNNELYHERADIFRSPRSMGSSTALLSVHSLWRVAEGNTKEPDTPELRWKAMVDLTLARDPGYFTSEAARMKKASKNVGKGLAAYPGLRVNRENCLDLDEIYKLRYRTKELMNMSSGASFKLLGSIVGQFLRWCIAAKKLGRRDGWKHNALFRNMANEDLVQVFINHFLTTASTCTVASKCNTLQTVCKYASLKFPDNATRLRIARVSLYLTSTFNAAKSKYRETARKRQDADKRIQEHTIVTEKQTQKGMRLATCVLDDICDSFNVKAKKKGTESAENMLQRTNGLVEKWCLNFVGLLTMCGGGQRPQAYARLQCPARETLELCYSDDFEEEVVSVKTFREKTARALDMPDVVFPISILPYIAFHVDFVRPVLIRRRRIPPSDIFQKNQPLLLHTRSGEYMTPSNISHTIRTFMRGVDSRLSNVTAMTLRASYATSMLHNYRQGKFDSEKLTEDEFLCLVAKQMNTSVEQLRGTYMATYSKDFKQTMKLFTKHFAIVMNENRDENDVYIEEAESGDKDIGTRSDHNEAHTQNEPSTAWPRMSAAFHDAGSDGEWTPRKWIGRSGNRKRPKSLLDEDSDEDGRMEDIFGEEEESE